TESPIPAGRDRPEPLRLEKVRAKVTAERFDLSRDLQQFRHHVLPAERFSAAECYLKGWLNIRLVLGGDVGLLCTSQMAGRSWYLYSEDGVLFTHKHENTWARDRQCRVDFIEVIGGKWRRSTGAYDEPVFVGDVEQIEAIESFIPAFIKPCAFDTSDDIFAGEVHLSIRNGGLKSVLRSGERELDFPRLLGLRPDH